MKKLQPKTPDSWKIPDLDKRPIIVALAGPNGAGKTSFYEAHLKASGLRFINADILAGELGIDAYQAAEIAAKLRTEFVSQREGFGFETVFSDPVSRETLQAFVRDQHLVFKVWKDDLIAQVREHLAEKYSHQDMSIVVESFDIKLARDISQKPTLAQNQSRGVRI